VRDGRSPLPGDPVAALIDPRTGQLIYTYEHFGGGGMECIGRRYYWTPSGRASEPWVLDEDLRALYPEIDDEEWALLHYEAFDRGESAFQEELMRTAPELFASAEGRQIAALGRIFGPRPPRRSSRPSWPRAS
jgi:hypothetical protein